MQPSSSSPVAGSSDRYLIHETIPFVLAHLVCVAAVWTGVHTADLILAAGLYAIRMFAITAGYHRYFSHRSFKTSRVFAFVLAFLAQTSAQRGILWWAANHRRHHRFSDTDDDVHSPVRRGFWHAHFGWFFTEAHKYTDLDAVPDLAKVPELVWLDRHPYLPAVLTGFGVWLVAGWSGLVVGFFWSTVALWHATFSINSVAHLVGRRRFETGDRSRNNWWLALLTFGEGWHNNHHHYQSTARQGFRWYEIDISYYLLKALACMRVVWDLQSPPAHALECGQRLRRVVVERAAGQLAASFQVERIASELHALVAEKRTSLSNSIDELHGDLAERVGAWRQQLDGKVDVARQELSEFLRTVPMMPTMTDLRARADAMFVRTPSMDDIVERARQILIDEVFQALLARNRAMTAARA